MIEGIKEIGEAILLKNPNAFLEKLSLKVKRENRKYYLVNINFDVRNSKVILNKKEVEENTPFKFLWIGTARGNKKQVYLTTGGAKKFTYIFSRKSFDDIIAICEILKKQDRDVDEFSELIESIIYKFYHSSQKFIRPEFFGLESITENLRIKIDKASSKFLREIDSLKSKTKIKEKKSSLIGKDSYFSNILPSEIINRWRKEFDKELKNLDKIGKASKVFRQLFISWKDNLKALLEETFKKDLRRLTKDSNTDESKLFFVRWVLKEFTDLDYEDVYLVTVRINSDIYEGYLVRHPGYKKIIQYEKIDQIFDFNYKYKSKLTKGICSLCGTLFKEKAIVSSNTTNLKFKYYMTDKIGFSSGMKGDFFGNFLLCKDCYKKLMVGETFIFNNFNIKLAGQPLLLIPLFLFPSNFNLDTLEEWAEPFKRHFNSIISIRDWKVWQALKNQLEEYKEYEGSQNNYVINLLFYNNPPGSSEFKILKLIPDVPPSRIETLLKTANELQDKAQEILGGKDSEWYLGLDDMYYLFPVRKSKNEFVDYRKVLEFYDALFTDKPVAYDFLIKQFVELAAIYRHGAICNYNIGRRNCQEEKWNEQKRDMALVKAILKANLLLLYLKELTQLDGGLSMSEKIFSEIISNLQRKKESVSGAKKKANIESQLHQYERLQRFIEEMGYSSLQIGLFLLGFLIGEIGKAQYDSSNKTKPILKKINYQGMDKGKILRLVNDVLEKLDQYKILSYNEVIYAEMKKLLDKNWQSWNISNEEAVFFVLSGYAYATYRAILKGEIKSEETNDVNKEEENE